MTVDFSQYRIVDLTQVIVPDTEPRPVHLEMVNAPEAIDNGMWYIMHKVEFFLNHVGTHIESPYHCRPDGMNIAQIPLETLCGDAIVLDLTGVEPGGTVTLKVVQAAIEAAGGMREGDIVLCRFDFVGEPGTNRWWTAESLKHLIDNGMKLMGVDLPGVELPAGDPRKTLQFNHHQLLDADIPLIELCANLKELTQSRVTVFCLPAPIDKLDSFPVRLIALETK